MRIIAAVSPEQLSAVRDLFRECGRSVGVDPAIRLYERLGFRRTGAYYDNPLPGVPYWEIDLNTCGSREEAP